MTTSEGTATPAERPAAEAETAPGSELSPKAAAARDTQERAPLTGRIAAPDDVGQLEQEIERTREHLGEMVQELAARMDPKSLARTKAAEVTGSVKSTTIQVRENAAARAESVRSQVLSQFATARQKAISASATGTDQLRGHVAAVGAPVWKAAPEPVRRAVTKGASTAREQWMPLAVTAGVLIVGYLAFRRWRGR
jgi:Protein of unknown function (DUF3618)